MICPSCQADNRPGAKYCDECGFPLSGMIAKMAALADEPSDPASASAREAECDGAGAKNPFVEAFASFDEAFAGFDVHVPLADLERTGSFEPVAVQPAAQSAPAAAEPPVQPAAAASAARSAAESPAQPAATTPTAAPVSAPAAPPAAVAPAAPDPTVRLDVPAASKTRVMPALDDEFFQQHSGNKPQAATVDEADSEAPDAAPSTPASEPDDDFDLEPEAPSRAPEGAESASGGGGEDDAEDGSFTPEAPLVSPTIADADLPDILIEGVNAHGDGSAVEAGDFSDLPDILVEGVNVGAEAEAGEPELDATLSFDAIPDGEANGAGVAGSAAADTWVAKAAYGAHRPAQERTSRFSDADWDADDDFEERLAGADYEPPRSAWGAGDTVEMPPVGEYSTTPRREYRVEDVSGKKRRRRLWVALGVVVAVVVLAAAAVAGTYYLQLWGGKVVPDVIGRTQSDAVYLLEQKGFTVSVAEVKSDEAEGVVVAESPGGGARTDTGTEVVIDVACAREIPDVVGMQRDEASALIAEEGIIEVVVVTEESDEHAGTVLSVEPEAGTKAYSDTAVTLTVAVGYSVTDVEGLTAEEAQEALEEKGYVVETTSVYDPDAEEGTVVSTEPSVGSELELGSTVVLCVAQSRAEALEDAAYAYLSEAGSVTLLDGNTYRIDDILGVRCDDAEENLVAFTISGPVVVVVAGETLATSQTYQVNGTVVFDDDDEILDVF